MDRSQNREYLPDLPTPPSPKMTILYTRKPARVVCEWGTDWSPLFSFLPFLSLLLLLLLFRDAQPIDSPAIVAVSTPHATRSVLRVKHVKIRSSVRPTTKLIIIIKLQVAYEWTERRLSVSLRCYNENNVKINTTHQMETKQNEREREIEGEGERKKLAAATCTLSIAAIIAATDDDDDNIHKIQIKINE